MESLTLSLNTNKSLLTVATTRGFKVFDTKNFKQLTDNKDDYMELIGPLKFVFPFFESNLIFFVGNEENLNFPPSRVIVWDDRCKRKLGVLMFNSSVMGLKVNRSGIFVLVSNKIIVFDLKTLKYKLTINKVLGHENIFNVTDNSIPMYITHCNYIKRNEVNIVKVKVNQNYEISGIIKKEIATPFPSINAIRISQTQKYLLVSGNLHNKIHIYSLKHLDLINCFHCDYPEYSILDLNWSQTDEHFFIAYSNLMIAIYSISKGENCSCLKELEDELLNRKSRSFIGDTFNILKKAIVYKQHYYASSWYRFTNNFTYNEDGYEIVDETGIGQLLCYFTKPFELTIIHISGNIERIQFALDQIGESWNTEKIKINL